MCLSEEWHHSDVPIINKYKHKTTPLNVAHRNHHVIISQEKDLKFASYDRD